MIPIPPEKIGEHVHELARRHDETLDKILASEGGEKFKHIIAAYCTGRILLDACDFYTKTAGFKDLKWVADRDQFEATVEEYKRALLVPLEGCYNLLHEEDENPKSPDSAKLNSKKYISRVDKFIGYFYPKYLAKREAEVKRDIEADGGVNKLTLSELEKRLGITKPLNFNEEWTEDNY